MPVETQVREFDAKLLLACVAAERGRPAYIGFQNRIRNCITSIPPGIFIAKGFAEKKATILRILTNLGHEIYAWDEEGLVHHPPYVYYDRRMSAHSLDYVSGLFAWGDDYKAMVEAYPNYDGTPIYSTGNPRADLLRPEVRQFYDPDVQRIRDRFGRFVLLNSSFGTSNLAVGGSSVEQNRFSQSVHDAASYWSGQLAYRADLFALYRDMTGALAARFPDRTFVVRPHPAEDMGSWRDFAASYPNLVIECEGNVTPWLMACDLMIHNGCMTAIEGALVDTPVIAYQPLRSETFDRHLPNNVSQSCETLDQLFDLVASIPGDNLPPPGNSRLHQALEGFLVQEEDRLAAEHIVDIIEQEARGRANGSKPPAINRYGAWCAAELRAAGKWLRSLRANDIYSPWHQRQQFPELSVAQVEEKIARFNNALGRFSTVSVSLAREDIFLLTSDTGS